MTPKRPQDWTAEEKLSVVIEAAALKDEELGAFLRRRGIHEAQIKEWRQMVLSGLDPNGLVLHSDNGSPMKGSTMLATLQRLGVMASFSRPG